MSLKSRLSQLQAQAGGGFGASGARASATNLRERLAQLQPERVQVQTKISRPGVSAEQLAQRLAGRQIAEGVIRIRQRIPLSARCGSISLADLEQHPRLPGETPDESLRGVYIDTETTGLSGGSGTIAFLLGSARLTHEAIELEQLLLTRFAAEPALLATFAAALTANDRLISYNGKSYDLPLLLTRYRMQAMPQTFTELPHLDLLHPVRRLFGRCWPDCRLITLEEKLLGFARHNDLPGAAAPAAWFDYLRWGDADRLIRVVEHNRQDIVSLVLAHATLARAVEQPQAYGADLTALARWLTATDPAAAHRLLQSHAQFLDDEGKRLLAWLARQTGDWHQALALWEELAVRGCTDSLERLAKYHEHVSKDLAAARRYCELLPADARQLHRRQRLAGKLAEQQNGLFEM